MMASVSSAAGESRRGRKANWARSMASAYSRRVRNCHPCAISTSSTPWSWATYASRISASPAWTAASPACGSRVRSSPTVSGRDDANSAASSSFARGLTLDHDRGERPLLRDAQGAALGELEQPAHQLGAWILPFVLSQPARQQQLRLDAQQPRRHLEIVGRLVQPQFADHREELIRDPRDREVGDVELVLVDQVQQQVERTRELLELDDETALLLDHGVGGGAHKGSAPGDTANPPTSATPTPMR